jgi:hypothetical protein
LNYKENGEETDTVGIYMYGEATKVNKDFLKGKPLDPSGVVNKSGANFVYPNILRQRGQLSFVTQGVTKFESLYYST